MVNCVIFKKRIGRSRSDEGCGVGWVERLDWIGNLRVTELCDQLLVSAINYSFRLVQIGKILNKHLLKKKLIFKHILVLKHTTIVSVPHCTDVLHTVNCRGFLFYPF